MEDEHDDQIKTLKYEIAELKAQSARLQAFDILRLRLAMDKIPGAGMSTKMASGVLIDIRDLNNQSITGQFGITDGLSPDTLKAITADLERTFLGRIDMNTPTALREQCRRILNPQPQSK